MGLRVAADDGVVFLDLAGAFLLLKVVLVFCLEDDMVVEMLWY